MRRTVVVVDPEIHTGRTASSLTWAQADIKHVSLWGVGSSSNGRQTVARGTAAASVQNTVYRFSK